VTTTTSLARRIIAEIPDRAFFANIPAEAYHSAVGLSCSMLKKAKPLASSMLHAIRREEREREELQRAADESGEVLPSRTESIEHFLVGSLVHHAILEPDKPLPGIAVTPATYTDAKGVAKKWTYQSEACKEWRNMQRRAGLIVLSRDAYETAVGCVRAIMEHPTAERYLRHGLSEVSIFRRFGTPFGEILLRSRPDHIPPGNCLIDIKTVKDAGGAEPSAFLREIEQRDYDMQAAMYLDAWNTLPEDQRPDWWEPKKVFVFIVVEKVWPHLVSLVYCEPTGIEIGRREYTDRAYIVAEACHSGHWPDYTEKPVGVHPSKWRLREAMEVWGG